MNSRYWWKTLIKLLNLTNSVYNFNNNGNETEKSDIKFTYWVGKAYLQVTQTVWGKGFKACLHMSTSALKPHWQVST